MSKISKKILKDLRALDTPTVCNALEIICPDKRDRGFSVIPFFCVRPKLPSIVGYARTARYRSMKRPVQASDIDGYYTYIAEGGPLPSVAVIEDMDESPGYGAFWGEVNTNVHYGLGCVGVITNGSVRDIPDSHKKFQMLAGMTNPAHAWSYIVDWGVEVTVHGMEVNSHDLIHADMHGAVVIPEEFADKVLEVAKKISIRENILISASQKPGFNIDKLRVAWKGMSEIH